MKPKQDETTNGGAATQSPMVWLSVSDAAALLGIGSRAVQKRAERGTLAARRVKHGSAIRWEIDGRKIGGDAPEIGSRDGRKMFAKRSRDGREHFPKIDGVERESVREMGAKRSQDVREPDGDLNARLLAQLESENKFLRATIEQLQRDGAETRAALRAALKLSESAAIPQLTTGTTAQNRAANDAQGTATNAELDDIATSNAVTSAPEREHLDDSDKATAKQADAAPLTYGDILRDLEARGF